MNIIIRLLIALACVTSVFLWPVTAAADTGTADNWPANGGTSDEQHFSSLSAINAENVARLGLAWSFELDTNRGQEATPLVVNGVLYTSTAWSKVYALDGATGKLLWKYDAKVPGRAAFNPCCDIVSRGVAYEDGKIFLATIDGRLQALDAKTGRVLWSTMTVDPSKPYSITGAPRVGHGKVFIGNSGADLGVRGYVSAYDIKTGALAWRFYTVPGHPEKKDHAASDDVLESLARPTWFGTKYLETGGGGTAWDAIVYDRELNQLYIGVGNGSPDNQVLRTGGKGDNLFLASIVAVNPDTGKYLWHYQEVPGETWDYTSTQPIMLASLDVGGAQRKVLLHAPKNGFFYVIDRHNGKLLSAEKFAPVNWADHIDLTTGRPVENPGARYIDKPFFSPVGSGGAHSWQAMSFSPQTGLVYIPAQTQPALFVREEPWTYRPGRANYGIDFLHTRIPESDAERRAMFAGVSGWLAAWNPVTQKEAWRVNRAEAWNGGTLATAGGLVFQGTGDHQFMAHSARDGAALWRYTTDAGIMAAPVTYRIGKEQFVAVLSGYGGAMLANPTFPGPHSVPNGRVWVFKLAGKATFTPAVPAPIPPLNVVQLDASAETVERGRLLFGDNCSVCHGFGTWSLGMIPDLKRSPALSDAQTWQTVVYDGALQSRGMIAFKEFLTAEEVQAIRAYVADESQRAAIRSKPPH